MSSAILAADPQAVVGLGDFQYDCDDPADYAQSYDPSYGRLDSIMHPIPGNHEYKTGTDAYGSQCPSTNTTAAPYFAHFALKESSDNSGDYSFDIGTWHFVGLNANCMYTGGCGATSPQTIWLQQDLASTTQPCIAAFWHQPLYQGLKVSVDKAYKPWWDALIAAHANLVLNGHIHNYQRFAPMTSLSTGSADGSPSTSSVRAARRKSWWPGSAALSLPIGRTPSATCPWICSRTGGIPTS